MRNLSLKVLVTFVVTLCLPSLSLRAENTASMDVYSSSIQILSHLTNVGTAVYFTSYDGQSIQPRNDSFVFSEEMSPSTSNPANYQMDYAVYIGTTIIEYGTISLVMPTDDTDQNGVYDWLQKNQAVNFSRTGTLEIQWPSSARATVPITFSFLRNSGNHVGNVAYGYSIGSSSFEGYTDWMVSSFSGSCVYDDHGNIDVVVTDVRNGVTFGFFGDGRFSVQGQNEIRLSDLSVSDTVYDYTVFPSNLERIGSQYRGEVSFVEGNFSTSWTDYERWVFLIDDPTDSDDDGIPDLSDLIDNTPIGTSLNTVGWNYHAWPWVYSASDQGWHYYAAVNNKFLLWREEDDNWYEFNSSTGKWDLFE